MKKTNPAKSWFSRVMGKLRIETPRITSNRLIQNEGAKGKLPRRVARSMQPTSIVNRISSSGTIKAPRPIGRQPKAS